MDRKRTSKPQGKISSVLKSLRELGYVSVACVGVLGVLILLAPTTTAPDKSPPSPVIKKHR
jgi:hypothetical protein